MFSLMKYMGWNTWVEIHVFIDEIHEIHGNTSHEIHGFLKSFQHIEN